MRYVAGFLIALLLVACSGEAGERAAQAFRPIAVGEPMPAYAVATLANDTLHLGEGTTGSLTLLNVWATWCGPCRKEFPALDRLHRAYGARGLHVVGVSVDVSGSNASIQDVARELGGTFTIARDPDGVIEERFRTIGVPETFLLSGDGRLLWKQLGDLTPRVDSLEALIQRQLADVGH